MVEGKSNNIHLKIKFLEECTKTLEDISVSKRLVKLFAILHFILALDYGFVECGNEAICFCLRLFPLVQACCFSAAAVYSMIYLETSPHNVVFAVMLTTKYALSALVLFICRNKMSFKEFQNELYKMDRIMGISIKSDTKIILTVSISATIMSLHLCSCIALYPEFNLFSFCSYCVPLISDCIPTWVMFFAFYDISQRLKHVENKIINDRNVDIMVYQRIYKRLADIIERHMSEIMNWMYGIVLIFGVPNMLNVVNAVAFTTIHESGAVFIMQLLLYVCIISVFTYAPAFAAGMLTTQAEKIPVALHNKLLSEQPNIDDYRKSDIEAFIMYANIRPFKYCVMKVVPLGWSLPVVVLNIVITYTIVILQFSHIV